MRVKFLLPLFLLFYSCDHGLKPPEQYEEPGFGGTVYFKGTWPDSVYDLRVVAFRNYPPQNIISEVIEGKAKFSQSLPVKVDSVKYEVSADTGKWEYVVVALQYGSNIFSDWKAIGVYDTTPNDTIPTPIYIPFGKFLRGINITCDFNNPPPQPFKLSEIIGLLITKQNESSK
ncbi:hypothetical protein [Candidatus Kryptobacter tengchongensis]|uniref:Uncharacterized protein n=1 Tax=Kryptobacter tengchongensis TaxID=1643429 RepID=A0A656D2J8_KRYT1|nr:hypothetical protein [Candidatus Kryptobacter tengchongensis]CUS96331.1 hypothetical protein JGI24_00090 [Candidatus Kryptobacter tengchongensis]